MPMITQWRATSRIPQTCCACRQPIPAGEAFFAALGWVADPKTGLRRSADDYRAHDDCNRAELRIAEIVAGTPFRSADPAPGVARPLWEAPPRLLDRIRYRFPRAFDRVDRARQQPADADA